MQRLLVRKQNNLLWALLTVAVCLTLLGLTPGQSQQLPNAIPGQAAAIAHEREKIKPFEFNGDGMSLMQAANSRVAHSIADAADLNAALAGATSLRTTFPNTSLGLQLQQVAQIIQVRTQLGMRRQIFFCSLGGFDTHSSEKNTL